MAKNKYDEEVRRAFEKFQADPEGMDQFIMANAREMAMADKVSKEIFGIIQERISDYHLGPNETMFALSKTTAMLIEILSTIGCNGDELEKQFTAVLGLGRMIARNEIKENMKRKSGA